MFMIILFYFCLARKSSYSTMEELLNSIIHSSFSSYFSLNHSFFPSSKRRLPLINGWKKNILDRYIFLITFFNKVFFFLFRSVFSFFLPCFFMNILLLPSHTTPQKTHFIFTSLSLAPC